MPPTEIATISQDMFGRVVKCHLEHSCSREVCMLANVDEKDEGFVVLFGWVLNCLVRVEVKGNTKSFC